MGFFDFFKGKPKQDIKMLDSTSEPVQEQTIHTIPSSMDQYIVDTPIQTPTVPEPEEKQTSIEDWILEPDSHTMVFSETDSKTGELILTLRRSAMSGKMIDLAVLNEPMDTESLKYLVRRFDMELDTPRKKGGFNPKSLKDLSKISIEHLDTLAEQKQLVLTPDIKKVLDSIDVKTQLIINPEARLDYQSFQQLPKTIDVNELGYDSLMQYGTILSARLQTLQGITSPETAYLHKDSLLDFMRYQEQKTKSSTLLAMLPDEQDIKTNPENIIKRNTILECAEAIEEVPNEDSLLYSAYLKLEEKRILNKIQEDIQNYQDTIGSDFSQVLSELEQSGLSSEDVNKQYQLKVQKCEEIFEKSQECLEIVEQSKIHPSSQQNLGELNETELQNEVIGYMAQTLTSINIKEYVSEGIKKDIILKSFISAHPEIQNRQVALDYITARMQSTGQVTDIPKQNSLRKFIETTDYKSEMDSEIPQFLLSVAEVEQQYIKGNYAPILNAYSKQMSKQQTSQNMTR